MRVLTEGRFIGKEKKNIDGKEKVYILVQQEGDTTQEKFGLDRNFMDFDVLENLKWGDLILLDASFLQGYNQVKRERFSYKVVSRIEVLDMPKLF